MVKKIVLIFLGLFLVAIGSTQAQDSNSLKLDLGADLMSRYVWRGSQFGGTSPSIQPYLSFSNEKLDFGFWGAYSIGGQNPYQEFDFYIAYTFANSLFTATITDYFFPNEDDNSNYFNYKHKTTAHVFEGMLSFNGTKNFPIRILLAINFHGADAARIEDDLTNSDFNTAVGIQKSTYLEFAYSTSIDHISLDLFAGASLSSPVLEDASTGFLGETGFYAQKAGLVNIGITVAKELKISNDFSLPISATIISNPQAESIFFVFGISL